MRISKFRYYIELFKIWLKKARGIFSEGDYLIQKKILNDLLKGFGPRLKQGDKYEYILNKMALFDVNPKDINPTQEEITKWNNYIKYPRSN